MLKYSYIPHEDSFAVGYSRPQRKSFILLVIGIESIETAMQIISDLEHKQKLEEARLARNALALGDRRTVSGFFSDKEELA